MSGRQPRRSVVLAFAAVALVLAPASPAAAQAELNWATDLRTEIVHNRDLRFGGVIVRISLTLDRPERCPGALRQRVHLHTGTPLDTGHLIGESTSRAPLEFTRRLDLDTRSFLSGSARCLALEPPGDQLIPNVESPSTFAIRMIDEDSSVLGPGNGPFYRGNWATVQGSNFSGGSTHQARQVDASATIEPGGYVYAAAWLTTRNHKPTGDDDLVHVACDRKLCATVATASPGGTRSRRVMGAGAASQFGSSDTPSGSNRLQIIAKDADGVDVDAFFIVENCADFRAAC